MNTQRMFAWSNALRCDPFSGDLPFLSTLSSEEGWMRRLPCASTPPYHPAHLRRCQATLVPIRRKIRSTVAAFADAESITLLPG